MPDGQRIRDITPLQRPPAATLSVPGSKSITNRALVLAALTARGVPCFVTHALRSEDTEVMVDSLRRLGFTVEERPDGPNATFIVGSDAGDPTIPADSADLFVGNSGTSMRFLTAMVALGQGRYRLDGVPRMRERPIADLIDALKRLGVNIRSEADNGCPPVVIEANGLRGGRVRIRGDVSSQFLSALMMAAPFADEDSVIEVEGPLVSVPYVEMTLRMMRQFGLHIDGDRTGPYAVRRGGTSIRSYEVEPDASAASYFFAAAAITGGRVTVLGLTDESMQGDVKFVDVLEQMGARVERCDAGITVHGGPLYGIDVDMNAISDTVMTLAAVACFADGPTTIRNVGHIRHKETDRLAALAAELSRVGVEVEERGDGLTITPRPLHGARIETYDDHRMAMSLSLVGLRVPGVGILNPGCVAKTYPGFFEDLETLRR